MTRLILIKHSLPEVVSDLPASRWRLSEEGRRRCRVLTEKLAAYDPGVIVTSVEAKAVETAEIIVDALGRPFEVVEGLHEHDRSNVGFLEKERFEGAVAEFFRRPQELVFGKETADQAHERFTKAIAVRMERHPDEDVAVITHGTVMALLVARANGLDPFPLWKRLGLPSFIVLSRPEIGLMSVVEEVVE
ncbi:histidine phosphatase family protein [bacterium]|nr:histidine phosphatase family protein [bacterium]